MYLASANEVNVVHKSRFLNMEVEKLIQLNKIELFFTHKLNYFLFLLFPVPISTFLQAIKNFPSQLASFPLSFSQLQLASHLFSTAVHHVRLDFLREPHLATL